MEPTPKAESSLSLRNSIRDMNTSTSSSSDESTRSEATRQEVSGSRRSSAFKLRKKSSASLKHASLDDGSVQRDDIPEIEGETEESVLTSYVWSLVGKQKTGEEFEKDWDILSTPSWSGSEGEWSDHRWLLMADHYDAQRRPSTAVDIEARKLLYPELYRSDVSICPSYSQFQLPYRVVCRRRYARSMRRMADQIAREIEEMALLQTRALDGVRMVRSFCQGTRPSPLPHDTLTDKERRRVEQLLAS